MSDILDSLLEIERLLLKYRHPGQAEVVHRIIDSLQDGTDDYKKVLNSVDMWGGSGAIWETSDGTEERADTVAFRTNIIALVDWMDEQGMGHARAAQIREIFRKWNQSNV